MSGKREKKRSNKLKIKIFANKKESKKDQLEQFLKLTRKKKKELLKSVSKLRAEFGGEYKLIKINDYIKQLKNDL